MQKMSTARISIPNAARKVPPSKRPSPRVKVAEKVVAQPEPAELPEQPPPEPPGVQLNEVLQQVQRMAATIGEFQRRNEAKLAEMRTLAIQVGIAAAEKVLARELKDGERKMAEIVESAIATYQPQKPLRIRLHPDDVEEVSRLIAGVEVLGDATLAKGDCQVEFDEFDLERSWEDHLQRIQSAIISGVDHARGD